MKRLLLGCCCCAALWGEAAATPYSDFNAGVAARSDHDADATIRLLSSALAAPELPAHLRPTAYYDRAGAYAENKKIDLAIADYTSCLALTPGDYNALTERGHLYEEREQYDLARADYAAAIRRRPDLLNGYALHAQANIDERKFDEAVKDYNDGLAASPNDLDLIALRGDALRMAGRYQDAIKDFDQVIDKDSKFSAAYTLRARANLESGNLRGAISDYEEAIDLEPDNLTLMETAGVAEWEYGRYRDAVRHFEKSAADPSLAAFSYLWIYLTGVKRDTADRDFAARAAKLDLKSWPGPIVNLYAGGASLDDVFAAAKQGDDDARQDQLCEANFFGGEWHLARAKKDEARSLLKDAVSTCRSDLPESHAAQTELKGLSP